MFLSDECCMVTGRKRILYQMFCSGTKLSVCFHLQVLSFKDIVFTIQLSSVRKQAVAGPVFDIQAEKSICSQASFSVRIIQDTKHFQINLCLA